MPQGLQQLHALNIVHNDVKAHNCLLTHQDNFLKLADLAYSMKLQTGMYFTPYLISLPCFYTRFASDPRSHRMRVNLHSLSGCSQQQQLGMSSLKGTAVNAFCCFSSFEVLCGVSALTNALLMQDCLALSLRCHQRAPRHTWPLSD